MLPHLITHLNPSHTENLLITINDLNHLEMLLRESSTNYMSCIRSVSQFLQGISMNKIIPLFAMVSLYHDRYLETNSHYLA